MRSIIERVVRTGLCAGALAWGAPSAATTVTVTLPTLTAVPGAAVSVPILMDQSLAGLGVMSIQYRLPFDPAKITAATETGTGVVDTWGAPFSYTSATQYSLAAAGVTPVTSLSTVLETVRLTVSASATVPSDQPLTLTSLLFNEGAPAATVVDGVLHIRSSTAVDVVAPGALALRALRPNPARGPVTVDFALPGGASPARLVVLGLDGRVVRVLATGAAAGAQSATWDTADAHGVPVPPGMYFVRLDCEGRALTRRLALMR